MALVIVIMALLAGLGVLLVVEVRPPVQPVAATVRDDGPARLLGGAVGLLAAEQVEWGQAMVGELDQIDGRGERWRFAVGCVSAAMMLPTRARAGAAVRALVGVAAGCAGLYAYAFIRYPGLVSDVGTWAGAAVFLAVLAGDTLACAVLVRRAGVAGAGLVGGLVVAATWLALGGVKSASKLVAPLTQLGIRPKAFGRQHRGGLLLLVVVLLAVGAVGTWRGGSAIGWRTALLAGLTASLSLFVTMAGATVATTGRPFLPGQIGEAYLSGARDARGFATWAVSAGLGDATMYFLVLLPLLSATIGWGGTALTARIRRA